MANQWFRMYAEFANDPKVQMLSETDQRRYIMLLCIRCNGDVTLQDEEVAFQLRISNAAWSETKALLVSKNLVNEDNQPTAWDKRQFASDSSASRVSKHREAKKQACNVTVTPQIQNRTDTETEKPIVAGKPTTPDVVESIQKPSCPSADIVALYHELMPNNPEVKVLNEARRGAIRARWKEAAALDCKPFGYSSRAEGLAAWRSFFEVCNESDFLTGKVQAQPGKPPFVADIDFLMSPSGFAKCLENKYHREAA